MNKIGRIKKIVSSVFLFLLICNSYLIAATSDQMLDNFYKSIDMSTYNSTVDLSNASEFVKALGVLDQNPEILENLLDRIISDSTYDDLQNVLGLDNNGKMANDTNAAENIYLLASIVDTVGYVIKNPEEGDANSSDYLNGIMLNEKLRKSEAAISAQSSANVDDKRWKCRWIRFRTSTI